MPPNSCGVPPNSGKPFSVGGGMLQDGCKLPVDSGGGLHKSCGVLPPFGEYSPTCCGYSHALCGVPPNSCGAPPNNGGVPPNSGKPLSVGGGMPSAVFTTPPNPTKVLPYFG